LRHRLERHLVSDGREAAPANGEAVAFVELANIFVKPPELGWRDYLVMLLQLGAEIEHALMVEYLYAAYSLGGEQVPADAREDVRDWRDSILTVAREEMGHLLTVQNLLCLLGGPPSFEREDYPWDSPFYPFPFRLEKLTLDSLSFYVFAEMDPGLPAVIPGEGEEGRHFEQHDRARIVKAVTDRVPEAHHVGEIYNVILDVIQDPELIPDTCFDADTYALQASWDEWGQGYRPVADDEDKPILTREPNLIVRQMASRTEAIDGLTAIAGQGEAPHLRGPHEKGPSHFDRFVEIYQAFEQVRGWSPARPVPVNPSTRSPEQGGTGTYIRSESSRAWASLLNVRYRLLLAYLAHLYRLPRHDAPQGARAAMLQRVFAEMFNVKAISETLVRLPLDDPQAPERAGPPFEMPYTTALPPDDVDCWRLYRDLLQTSQSLCTGLLAEAPAVVGGDYLLALRQLDGDAVAWLDHLVSVSPRRTGARA
jgi:Ferritin-like